MLRGKIKKLFTCGSGGTRVDLSACLEFFFMFAGMALLFFLPHSTGSDGYWRFDAVSRLMESGQLSDTKYSLAGPLFSLPLYALGKVYKTPQWWCTRYNFFVFLFGICILYNILKNYVDARTVRRFLLILVFGSMFAHHQTLFYGELFTAVLVGVGIVAVNTRYPFWGWFAIVLGVVNTPAALGGLLCVVVKKTFDEKRWRYFSAVCVTVGLILLEAWLRRKNPFLTGYEGDKGYRTVLPFSGRPDFSYPFFFGVLSILFSFGKGIVFFASGLLFISRGKLAQLAKQLRASFMLWMCFLIGLILVYAKYWGWYGGWFWGPRYFLFASIPASFALALSTSSGNKSGLVTLLTLMGLLWSFWVGINGAVFGLHGLQICLSNQYALESLCWYVPEFSVLFHPFVAMKPLTAYAIAMIGCWTACFLFLSFPLGMSLVKTVKMQFLRLARTDFNF